MLEIFVGSVLTVAVVLLLIAAVARPRIGEVGGLRTTAYMLLLGVPALVLPMDLLGLAAMTSTSIAMFELILVAFAL